MALRLHAGFRSKCSKCAACPVVPALCAGEACRIERK